MIGKSHYYSELNSQVLGDYIGGGDHQEATTAERASFSDIT